MKNGAAIGAGTILAAATAMVMSLDSEPEIEAPRPVVRSCRMLINPDLPTEDFERIARTLPESVLYEHRLWERDKRTTEEFILLCLREVRDSGGETPQK